MLLPYGPAPEPEPLRGAPVRHPLVCRLAAIKELFFGCIYKESAHDAHIHGRHGHEKERSTPEIPGHDSV